MNGNKELETIYPFVEIMYIKAMGREVSIDPNANIDLFPLGWYSDINYDKKINILKEAIDKKILIIDTKLYQENIEGVRNSL